MRASAIVIQHVRQEYVAQVSLAEDDDIIKAFPSDRADQPFSMSILPWRSWRGWLVTNAHGAKPHRYRLRLLRQQSAEDLAIGAPRSLCENRFEEASKTPLFFFQ
jgi:hypothetical protein